jgi:hypothetical protein
LFAYHGNAIGRYSAFFAFVGEIPKMEFLMKITDVKLSKTFSAIILIVIASIFLLPVLGANFMFWHADYKEQRYVGSLKEGVEYRISNVKNSIAQLNIVDSVLLHCIHELSFERANLPLTSSGGIDSVTELWWLGCSGKGVTNIAGIDALRQLSSLDLSDNNITNIHFLSVLDKLEDLDLSNNLIADIAPLSVLSSIKKLRISGNQLQSLEPMLSMSGLQEIDMPDTAQIYCSDVEAFLNSAKFLVRQPAHRQQCKGMYSSDIGRILAVKAAGGLLSLEDESKLLEYQLNEMRIAYKRKYK